MPVATGEGCSMGPSRPQTPALPKQAASGLGFRGLRAPASRGYFALGGKVTKTPPGTPRTQFLHNRTPAGIFCAATEIPQACWPLVIGLVGILLRLTALGLWVISTFVDESL